MLTRTLFGSMIFLLVALSATQVAANTPVTFQELLNAGTRVAQSDSQRFEVINDAKNLRRAWRAAGIKRPVPSINFARRSVVALMYGRVSMSGHRLQVKRIREQGNTLAVDVHMSEPGLGCFFQPVANYPFVFVSMPKTDKRVSLNMRVTLDECLGPNR